MRAMTMLPAFSLVIPAFNEAERIGETSRDVIDYLREASPESEMIVVNDGSIDATSEVTRKVLDDGKQTRDSFAREFPESRQRRSRAPRFARGAKTNRVCFPTPICPRRLKKHRS